MCLYMSVNVNLAGMLSEASQNSRTRGLHLKTTATVILSLFFSQQFLFRILARNSAFDVRLRRTSSARYIKHNTIIHILVYPLNWFLLLFITQAVGKVKPSHRKVCVLEIFHQYA